MKVVAVIQARMGSTRLPGKVLMPILGQALLELLVCRVARVKLIDQIVVATSLERQDDKIAELVSGLDDVVLFRGSEQDVLSRFVGAARDVDADVIMRITADNPFFDWALADRAIETFINGDFDYLSTPDYPHGIGMEVFSGKALFRADQDTADPYDREHVTAYFYHNPQLFSLGEMKCTENLSHVRLTVDTPEDMARAKGLFNRFGVDVTYREIIDAES